MWQQRKRKKYVSVYKLLPKSSYILFFISLWLYKYIHLYTYVYDVPILHTTTTTTNSLSHSVRSLAFILSNRIKRSSNTIWKIWYNYILIFRSHYVVIKSRKMYFDSIPLCLLLYVHFIWYSTMFIHLNTATVTTQAELCSVMCCAMLCYAVMYWSNNNGM